MKNSVTSDRLNQVLFKIGNFIWDYPYSNIRNVVFINEDAFYSYMENQKIENTTLKSLIDEIENCIPFSLTEISHNIFMDAFYSTSYEEAENLCEKFKHQCKVNFLKEIRLIKSDLQWQKLVALCQKIREENLNFDFIIQKI